ncbi:rRNA maturation RNase YbeY [Nitrospira sp. Kam-Ns4a]
MPGAAPAARARALTQLAQRVLAAAGAPAAELSLELVGDGRMRRLNRRYRGRDAPTDVLAFALRDAPGPRSSLLGDVVISLPTAARQAAEAGRRLDHELAALLIHGVLHLLGYDHERSARAAARMRRKERAVLQAVGRIPKLTT